MKITNFRLIKVDYSFLGTDFRAIVDVEESFGLFRTKRKKETREIYKRAGRSRWFFSDSGEFTPEFQVETLIRVLEAKEGRSLEDCKIEPRHAIKAVAQFLEARKKEMEP